MANKPRPPKTGEYRSKLGPIPLDHFGNDPTNYAPEKVKTNPGSTYDRLKKRVEERESKK